MRIRTFTKEFRQQAVDLATHLSSIKEAARQLGISDSSIHGWRKKLGKDSEAGGSPEVSGTDVEELKRLRRETAEQKKVIHILKAAAAFFSQDHLK